MRSSTFLFAVAGLALAAPQPQGMDLEAVATAPPPVFITPIYRGVNQIATVLPVSSQAAAAAAAISTDPVSVNSFTTVGPSASGSPLIKRSNSVGKRDGTCAPQNLGAGPVAVPDTPVAFTQNSALWNMALTAPTPAGYLLAFSNLTASLSASNYMGLYILQSYDPLACQSLCDQNNCAAFNIYAERDPSLDANAINCPNPPSTTNYACTLWGAPVSAYQATNFGQWRDSFQVLISASNAYNKIAPPDPIPGFSGPVEFGGAINAPHGYMGYKYYPFSQSQGYSPSTCAAACVAQTTFDQAHPASDGTYDTCNFFNSYVLSKNGVPQGLYCSFYTQSWSPQYAVNYGQYRDGDHYTVSESYGFTWVPSSSSSTTSTAPTATTTSAANCITPKTISPPPSACTIASDGHGHTWFNYFAGQGLTETENNPGNVGYTPRYRNLPGTLSTCGAINACAYQTYLYPETGYSFDVHFLVSTQTWQCVIYYDWNKNPAFYNVVNCDVSQSYGYTITGTSDYVPDCYGTNNPACPEYPNE